MIKFYNQILQILIEATYIIQHSNLKSQETAITKSRTFDLD